MINNDLFIQKLRSSGLRPTKQRIEICKFLFDRHKTFHFTINGLNNFFKKKSKKISLATIYNTIHAFKNKGYLIEISINADKCYYDTNVTNHHHFFNESTKELIDIDNNEVGKIKINKSIPGKKIKSVELLIKIANSN